MHFGANLFIFGLKLRKLMMFNPCLAEPGHTLPLQTVDPDQLASKKPTALFAIQYVNLYQQSGLSNLTG